MLINPVSNGLLWAAYLLCLLLSGVQSPYPATGVVPNVTPTAASGNTYVASATNFAVPPFAISAWPPFTRIYPVTLFTPTANNLRSFTNDMTLRYMYSTGYANTMGTVIKDSLVLGAARFTAANKDFIQLAVSGATMTTTLIGQNSTGAVRAQRMIDVPSTNQVVAAGQSNIYKITPSPYLESNYASLVNGVFVRAIFNLPTIDAYIVGKEQTLIPILARADFSTIKTPAFTGDCSNYLVDNLDDKYVMMFTTTTNLLRHFNLVTWTVDTDTIHTDIDLTSYGLRNNILNFGPYQYVVTIPEATAAPSTAVVVSKQSFTVTDTFTAAALAASFNTPYFGTVVYDADRIHFVVRDATVMNFQSYYLTVDRCINRDGSNICQECITGYYRMGTAANNVCNSTGEFLAGWGIVVGTTPGLANLCTEAHCTSCVNDKAICLGCDTANSWYLNGAACQSPTLTPLIPSGFGANTGTGLVVACQDTHCLLCKATYTTCTGCDTGSSWYLNGAVCQSPTLAPQIPSGFGANTGTGLVVACQDTHCLECKANYLICTICDTGSSWYLNGAVCQSPTLTPQIPSGFGANTGTGLVVACQDTHCLLCKATYTTCTGCDTGSSWYLNGAVCQSPTLTPQIPSGFGANTGTGLVVACQDTHCLECKANYLICTICDSANSWYLYSGSCYSPTLAPQIPDFYGANSVTGQAVTCGVANCMLCKTDYTVCTQCDYANAWYLNGNVCQSPTASPQIPSGFGASTTSYLVVPCSEAHCLLCKSNYLTCTGCDSANSWYLNGATCQSPTLLPQIPTSFGANTATGGVVACSDSNCLLCKASYTTCTGCDTANSWYLNGAVCQSPTLSPLIPDFYGANTGSGTVVNCAPAHCRECKPDYLICSACDTANLWYLNGNVCQNAASFPSGFGPNIATGLVAPCSDPLCNSCPFTINTCGGCANALGFYINLNTSICIHTSQMPVGFGPDLVTLIIVACSTSSCTDCHLNSSECLACDTSAGFYLFNGSCITLPAVPAGFGFNTLTSTITTCASIGCLDCKFDNTQCSQCDNGNNYFLDGTLCKTPNQSTVETCEAPHCTNCAANYQNCTECDQANGYVLVDGTCQRITIISTAIKPTKADVDLSWRESVPETNIPVTTSTVLTALEANKARFRLYLKEDDRTLGKDDFQLAVAKYADFIVLDFTLPQDLPKEQYTVTLLGFDFNVTGGSPTQNITAMVLRGTASYFPGKKNHFLIDILRPAVEYPATTVAAPDSAPGLAVMSVLLAADHTGAFFRVTKILQIVNKLYFININYGKRLEAFLAKSATRDRYEPNPDRPERVYNQANYRGKLSRNKITLSGIALPLMMYKIIVYVLSWLVRGAKRLLLDNCLMGKVGIYSCYYANKVHLIIFNLVFIDFIWLAPRTLMHSRGLSLGTFYLSLAVMCLIAADLCLLLAHLLDDRIWRRALEHYTSLKEFCPAPELSSKEKRNDSSMNALKKPDQPSEQDGPNQPQTKQINYKRTYFEIDFNVHLMDMATNTLSLTKDVYDSMIVRLLVAQLWFRVPLMFFYIMTTQYANCFGITIMLSIELSKLFATIYAYLKYKYLKNIICLLMELSQAIAFSLFYYLALLISPKRFDETISDIYQDAGIWIVIASCVAEYLLLLTYIGVAAYDFFKNRRMMKKMNVQRKQQSLIKYSEASSSNSLCLRQPVISLMSRAASSKAQTQRSNFSVNEKGAHIKLNKPPQKVIKVQSSRVKAEEGEWNNVEGLEKGVKESINKTRFGSKKNVGNARIEEKNGDQMAVKKSLEVKGNQDDWKLRNDVPDMSERVGILNNAQESPTSNVKNKGIKNKKISEKKKEEDIKMNEQTSPVVEAGSKV